MSIKSSVNNNIPLGPENPWLPVLPRFPLNPYKTQNKILGNISEIGLIIITKKADSQDTYQKKLDKLVYKK